MLLALLFMRYAREICEFHGRRTQKHNTFSLFITRARPETIEGLFKELRDQAFSLGIVDPEGAVKLSMDSTFMEANSRRGRKGGISDRGARVGRTGRRSYRLG